MWEGWALGAGTGSEQAKGAPRKEPDLVVARGLWSLKASLHSCFHNAIASKENMCFK